MDEAAIAWVRGMSGIARIIIVSRYDSDCSFFCLIRRRQACSKLRFAMLFQQKLANLARLQTLSTKPDDPLADGMPNFQAMCKVVCKEPPERDGVAHLVSPLQHSTASKTVVSTWKWQPSSSRRFFS